MDYGCCHVSCTQKVKNEPLPNILCGPLGLQNCSRSMESFCAWVLDPVCLALALVPLPTVEYQPAPYLSWGGLQH